jgi:endonuclease/exonuclease/phosphatase family metal-dependent hydrolase
MVCSPDLKVRRSICSGAARSLQAAAGFSTFVIARQRRQLVSHVIVSLVLAAALGAAGCASPGPIVAELPAAAGCRTTIAPDGTTPAQQVRWIRPEAAEERAALDDWCRAVGPAVVVTSPQAPLPGAESSDLVVISWNVNVGGGDIAGLVGSLRSGGLTGHPVSRFVLLLQEAFRDGPDVPRGAVAGARAAGAIRPHVVNRDRTGIVSIANALGLALAYVPSMRNGTGFEPGEDRGNAILSTEPLSDVTAVELPFERQRRVAVGASITTNGPDGEPLTLRFTDVHLDNRAPARRLWLFATPMRLRQVRGLLLALDRTGPAIVGGDFNTWYGFDDPVFNEIAGAFDDRIPSDRRPTFAGLLRLDHLFFRLPDEWQAATSRIEKFGSDHHPLMARIGMPAGLDDRLRAWPQPRPTSDLLPVLR